MGFVGSLAKVSFKGRIAQALMHKEFTRILKAGVLAYLREAERIIPIWTGESRGSLQPIADAIGKQVQTISKSNTAPGNLAPKGATQGHATLTVRRGFYQFSFESEVFKLNINERIDATEYGLRLRQPGPYNFREQCNDAFERAVLEEYEKLTLSRLIIRNFKVETERLGG